MLSGLSNIVDNVFILLNIRIFYIILYVFINSFIASLLYFKPEIETSEQKLRYQGKYRIIDDGDDAHYKCIFCTLFVEYCSYYKSLELFIFVFLMCFVTLSKVFRNIIILIGLSTLQTK